MIGMIYLIICGVLIYVSCIVYCKFISALRHFHVHVGMRCNIACIYPSMRPVRISIQYYSGFYIAINLFYDIVSGYHEPVATVYAIGYVFTVYILRGKSVSIRNISGANDEVRIFHREISNARYRLVSAYGAGEVIKRC